MELCFIFPLGKICYSGDSNILAIQKKKDNNYSSLSLMFFVDIVCLAFVNSVICLFMYLITCFFVSVRQIQCLKILMMN